MDNIFNIINTCHCYVDYLKLSSIKEFLFHNITCKI